MASLNKVMLIGNAGRDAELRYMASGTPQCQFSLAVNNRRRNQTTNEWEDQTEWFNIIIWGDTAERVSQYITKGKPVFIEGRLQTRSWDGDDGVKHYRMPQTEVTKAVDIPLSKRFILCLIESVVEVSKSVIPKVSPKNVPKIPTPIKRLGRFS